MLEQIITFLIINLINTVKLDENDIGNDMQNLIKRFKSPTIAYKICNPVYTVIISFFNYIYCILYTVYVNLYVYLENIR